MIHKTLIPVVLAVLLLASLSLVTNAAPPPPLATRGTPNFLVGACDYPSPLATISGTVTNGFTLSPVTNGSASLTEVSTNTYCFGVRVTSGTYSLGPVGLGFGQGFLLRVAAKNCDAFLYIFSGIGDETKNVTLSCTQ